MIMMIIVIIVINDDDLYTTDVVETKHSNDKPRKAAAHQRAKPESTKPRRSLSLGPPFRQRSCYLARMEPPLPLWQSLGLPFQLATWLAILAGLLLSGPVLFSLARATGGAR